MMSLLSSHSAVLPKEEQAELLERLRRLYSLKRPFQQSPAAAPLAFGTKSTGSRISNHELEGESRANPYHHRSSRVYLRPVPLRLLGEGHSMAPLFSELDVHCFDCAGAQGKSLGILYRLGCGSSMGLHKPVCDNFPQSGTRSIACIRPDRTSQPS